MVARLRTSRPSQMAASQNARVASKDAGSNPFEVISNRRKNVARIEATTAHLWSGDRNKYSTSNLPSRLAMSAPTFAAAAKSNKLACQGKRTESNDTLVCAPAKNNNVAAIQVKATNFSRHANQNAPAAYSTRRKETRCGSPANPTPWTVTSSKLTIATPQAENKYENASRCRRFLLIHSFVIANSTNGMIKALPVLTLLVTFSNEVT